MEGLRPGKGYLFRVRASNAKGQGPWSVVAAAETQAAPPEAPSQPAISQRTSTSARCKWDVPVEDHGAAVLRYRYASYCAWHGHGFTWRVMHAWGVSLSIGHAPCWGVVGEGRQLT